MYYCPEKSLVFKHSEMGSSISAVESGTSKEISEKEDIRITELRKEVQELRNEVKDFKFKIKKYRKILIFL